MLFLISGFAAPRGTEEEDRSGEGDDGCAERVQRTVRRSGAFRGIHEAFEADEPGIGEC
jgi:hypothetical protein